MEDLLRVGVISSAHGIKGEVNVFPTTDEPEMFAHWKTLRLVEKKQSRLIHVRGAKYFKNMALPVANHTVVAPSDLILLIGTGLG